jgi:hypothetical protein
LCLPYVSAGSRRDQQQAYFTGGSQELQDMSYMAVPKDHKGTLLNKYGYKTQTSGNVKVREHATTTSILDLGKLRAANVQPGAPLRQQMQE